jgi:hypothetical protein
MFPSHTPTLYVLQTLVVVLAITAAMFVGWALAQPLCVLSLLALQYLPDVPLVQMPEPVYFGPEGDAQDEDEDGYGSSKIGFH